MYQGTIREFQRKRRKTPCPLLRLSLPFTAFSLDIEGSCRSWVYAYAVFALTDIGREIKDFCGGQNFRDPQGFIDSGALRIRWMK